MKAEPLRLFVAQFVIVMEDQWFAPDTDGPPIRTEKQYHIQTSLFAAADAEAAYAIAVDWSEGFSDSNHDGSGDLTKTYALGIHQIEKVLSSPDNLNKDVHELYGVDVGTYFPKDTDSDGVPLVRSRTELEIFRRGA